MSCSRADRERELVALLLFDRAGLAATYRRVLGLPLKQPLTGLRDREMVREILEREYPSEVRHHHSDSAPLWSATAAPNASAH